MPPRIRVDKQAILQTAFEITKEEGLGAITARSLAQRLGCSTQPIFRAYENMDTLKSELFEFTNQYFAQYIMEPADEGNQFSSIGFRYVQFAYEESKLFTMVFMSGYLRSQGIIELFTSDADNIEIMKTIPSFSNFSSEQIKDLFARIAIFTHGIAALVATNDIKFDSQVIRGLLDDTFSALVKDTKSKEPRA